MAMSAAMISSRSRCSSGTPSSRSSCSRPFPRDCRCPRDAARDEPAVRVHGVPRRRKPGRVIVSHVIFVKDLRLMHWSVEAEAEAVV
jgi:hypothetical protein